MKDFTIKIYRQFLQAFLANERGFYTFADTSESDKNSFIILRHDVDARPQNSLRFAQIQNEMGISGTYYFRIVPQSFDEKIMREIAGLGHEVGYHYETMDTCRGNVDKAYDEFCRNLEKFRKLVPIKTISMHGSPLSKYDNRYIWHKYSYRDLGIAGEPYFDTDFTQVLYLTDTGRRWDGDKVSVRDKPLSSRQSGKEDRKTGEREESAEAQDILEHPNTRTPKHSSSSQNSKLKTQLLNKVYRFRTTNDIIRAAQENRLPDKIMLTFHPQRWTDKPLPWLKELVLQNVKNVAKRILIARRK